jgi:hypothetical protein
MFSSYQYENLNTAVQMGNNRRRGLEVCKVTGAITLHVKNVSKSN